MKVNLAPLMAKAKNEERAQIKVNGHRTRMKDGVQYIVHEVKSTDSLMKLSILY